SEDDQQRPCADVWNQRGNFGDSERQNWRQTALHECEGTSSEYGQNKSVPLPETLNFHRFILSIDPDKFQERSIPANLVPPIRFFLCGLCVFVVKSVGHE